MTSRSRPPIPLSTQVSVLYRDRWLCRWCGRPVVFAPSLKYLSTFVTEQGFAGPLAYYNLQYSRDAAPLLDELGAAIDHVHAYSRAGAHDETNFVTACSRCNAKKGSGDAESFANRHPRPLVRAKHGEPNHWDGLAAYFIVVGR